MMGSIEELEPPEDLDYEENRETGAFPFFRSLGMDTERNMCKAVADFYLLEGMVADNYGPAVEPLRQYEEAMGREFSAYLDMAVGGEVRHAGECEEYGVEIPKGLTRYIRAAREVRFSRGKCWRIWTRMRSLNPESVRWFVDCVEVFNDPLWPHRGSRYRVGGPAWSTAASVVHDYFTKAIKPRTFLDRCFTLQHNNDYIFDKVYKVKGMNEVLEIQESGDYNKLARYASRKVVSTWQYRKQLGGTAQGKKWLAEDAASTRKLAELRCEECGRIRTTPEMWGGFCQGCDGKA
jgi:hypothetical protein